MYQIRMIAHVFGFGLLLLVALLISSAVIERLCPPETTPHMLQAAEAARRRLDRTQPDAPFVFDGCTVIPEESIEWLLGVDLTTPCLQHDIAYWLGGSEAEKVAADRELYTGVTEQGRVSMPALAHVMHWSVDHFGAGYLAQWLGRQWGHGYHSEDSGG